MQGTVTGYASASPVPEPTSSGLMAAGGLLLWLWQRRRTGALR
ncbi:MAG: PEP-CTERM sorting domain-containing protein [Rubrivivax sp.]|nr:PEP-CTERM sorting domain-containing protein [Rubrivivax sp.]